MSIPFETLRALQRKGHRIQAADGPFGGYQAIARNPDGGWIGASESRKGGHTAGH